MTSRIIDPTRQGIAHPETESERDARQALPVTLDEACKIVDSWPEGYAPFPMYQVCRTLKKGYEGQRQNFGNALKEWNRTLTLLEEAEQVADDYRILYEEIFDAWEAYEDRVKAAVPCALGKENCTGPEHRWAPCCTLRVALLPGEPFEVEELDDGWLHLICPEPRKSYGFVKLIEPTFHVERAPLLGGVYRKEGE